MILLIAYTFYSQNIALLVSHLGTSNLDFKVFYFTIRFLMISNPQDLQKSANWEGKGPKSRAKLLEKLQG